MTFIDNVVIIKEQIGHHISKCAKFLLTSLLVLLILKIEKIINIYPAILSTIFMLLLSCLFINYSPLIKNYIEKTKFDRIRIKIFNHAHTLDKALVILIVAPIWLAFSFVFAKGFYINAMSEIDQLSAIFVSSLIFLICFIVFYVVFIKRKRPFLLSTPGFFEGIFKPSLIKSNDLVAVISDDERGKYSGTVITNETIDIKRLKNKAVFKRQFHLPFNSTPTCAIDIGFGMYINAPLDRITILTSRNDLTA